ncbi:MAG: MFS transporter [Proteobacteria bacterium]|nr:MFS transporter [Pseudomonadota bacterium]
MKTSIGPESLTSNYKWYVLTLAALTHTIVVGIPLMAIPVLFDEMSKELDLNLIQMGWIWGIGFLTGIVTSLIGGALGDRFGAKWTLAVCCFLSGITGALRGLSGDFVTLAATAFLCRCRLAFPVGRESCLGGSHYRGRGPRWFYGGFDDVGPRARKGWHKVWGHGHRNGAALFSSGEPGVPTPW